MESRRQRKKEEARARIIATAIELFSRHGFADVTVEHIADVADVGKGTVYNYFATKEEIVVAFLAGLERELQSKLLSAASKGSLESILSGYIRFHFREKRRYHGFVRVFLAQMFLHTKDFLPYMVEMQKAIDPPLEKLFRSLQERKLIRGDVKVPELIVTFKTIHLGLTALWAVEGPPFRQTERVLRQEIRLFCEGLEAKKP
jgi:TetR/AcrR family fatty acid metabolism transcriptional regulator